MKIKTIAFATTMFAFSASLALAPAQAKHHRYHHHHMMKQSGPGMEPGAPDASRVGGKGVSNKPE